MFNLKILLRYLILLLVFQSNISLAVNPVKRKRMQQLIFQIRKNLRNKNHNTAKINLDLAYQHLNTIKDLQFKRNKLIIVNNLDRRIKNTSLNDKPIALGVNAKLLNYRNNRDRNYIQNVLNSNFNKLIGSDLRGDELDNLLNKSNEVFKILFVNGRPAGFIAYNLTDSVIDWIYVNRQFSKNGYGSKMLNFAINQLKNHKFNKICAVILDDNYRAKRFFKRKGFKLQIRRGFIDVFEKRI